MPLPFLIAWRYLWGARDQRALSTMTLICFLGMAIGAGALALVVSVMAGFEKETHKALKSIHASITMQSVGSDLDEQKILPLLQQEFPEIKGASPYLLKQVIIQSAHAKGTNHVLFLKGVDAIAEQQVSAIGKKIIAPVQATMSNALANNSILIGTKLAEQLRAKVGDTLALIYPEDEAGRSKRLSLAQKDVVVGGIFKTGIAEFDESFAYAPLSLVQALFPEAGMSHIAVALDDTADEQDVIVRLRKRFKLDVYSWKDLYPALVSALKLEKYAMFFVLLLIAIVAAMNIISLLFMHILSKRADIAILKSMGMPARSIRRIFLLVGISIGASGAACGLLLSWIIGWYMQHHPFIELPDTYYVRHLPIILDPLVFVFIFICVLAICIIATLIPLRTIKTINIARILRFEG